MTDAVRLNYFLPSVGSLHVDLREESAELYSTLTHNREIERLKSLPQLGLISSAHESANHSKWAYVMLTLDLLRRAKALPAIKLNTKIQASPDASVSSVQELLSCWALLLNTGHLHWTFTTEAALLEAIGASSKASELTNELLAATPSETTRSWAKSIFEQGRVYQLFQLLAFYRSWKTLQSLPAGRSSYFKSLLAAYVAPRSNERLQLTRARNLFKRARRLAFLALDADYSPSVLHISLARVVNHEPALERLLLAGERPGSDELSGLEQYLTTNVYSGESAMREVGRRFAKLDDRLRSMLGSQPLRTCVEQLGSIDWYRGVKPRQLTVSFRFQLATTNPLLNVPDSLTEPANVGNYFRNALKGAASDSSSVVVQRDAQGQYLFVQGHASSNLHVRAHVLASSLAWAAGWTAAKPPEGLDLVGVPAGYVAHRWTLGPLADEIVQRALGLFLNPGLRWEWDHHVAGLHAVLGRPSELSALMESFASEPTLSKARAHELRSSIAVARAARTGDCALAAANLRAFDEAGTPIAEVDGAIVWFDQARAELVLSIVEAKHQKTQALAHCRRDLSRKLQALAPCNEVHLAAIRSSAEGRRARAWAHLRLGIAPDTE